MSISLPLSLSLPPSLLLLSDPNNTCDDGLIRLADGATLNEGRLEICYYGHWGTVCDDGFNSEAATVACRQLGFEGEGYHYFILCVCVCVCCYTNNTAALHSLLNV